jgi:hypothetical protein
MIRTFEQLKDMSNFVDWLNEINKYLPCHRDDLPDVPYRDWFDKGVSAKSAAKRALKYAGEN